jgi:hypothetical protein
MLGWFKRALKETISSAGTPQQIMFGVLAFVLGVLISIGRKGPAAVPEIIDLLISGTAAAALAALALFVYNLFAVPYRAQAETIATLQQQLATLKAAVAQHSIQQSTSRIERARVLTVLWERGQELMLERIAIDQLGDWSRRVDKWEVLTLKYIATKYSQQEAVAFRVSAYNANKYTYQVNDEHGKKLTGLSIRCRQLKETLGKEPASWSPISREQRDAVCEYLGRIEAKLAASNGDKAL